MRLLYITLKPFLPDSRGGAQLSTITLLKELKSRGWEVRVIALRYPKWLAALTNILGHMMLLRRPALTSQIEFDGVNIDRVNSFSKLKHFGSLMDSHCLKPRICELIQVIKPDIVMGDFLASDNLFKFCVDEGIPCVKMIRSLPIVEPPTIVPSKLQILGNSPYSARVATAMFGRKVEFVQPFIRRADYRVDQRKPKYITFINPIGHKGLHIAVAVARALPGLPFMFVMGRWSDFSRSRIEGLVEEASTVPNIDLVEHQHDMKEVYAKTRVLLAPSQFIETFGRVIVEAQMNGIPVVGADVGGIRETLGAGGIVVGHRESAQNYVDAIQTILSNEAEYCARALKNIDDDENLLNYQVDKFERLVHSWINQDK